MTPRIVLLAMTAGSFGIASNSLLVPIDKCAGARWSTQGVAPVDPCPQDDESAKPKPPMAAPEAP